VLPVFGRQQLMLRPGDASPPHARALKPLKQEDPLAANGPPVGVSANTSLSLTLCLHELATNALGASGAMFADEKTILPG
jgi:hypothetical protein